MTQETQRGRRRRSAPITPAGPILDITPLVRAVENPDAEDAFPTRLPPACWHALAPCLERRELAAGELLIRRGDRERVAYLLEQGQLQVFVSGGPPGSHRIATLRAGAVVGEPGWFIDAPRMASVEAMSPSVVWALPAARLAALATERPDCVLALLQAAGALMALRMRANLERGIPTA
jgi:CRP/FNR family cyclic AMP-dependent transcriptional regulator